MAAHPALRNGLFARGSVELGQTTALAIPLSAVRNDQAQPYAIRVHDGRAERRVLVLGSQGQALQAAAGDGPWVEVRSGLQAGDLVLAASAGLVPDGVRLKLPAAVAAPVAAPFTVGASAAPTAAR